MAKQRHLSKAPITEALINIQVMLPTQARTIEHLAALDEKFLEQYPDKKTIEEFQSKFEGGLPHPGQSCSGWYICVIIATLWPFLSGTTMREKNPAYIWGSAFGTTGT